MIYITQYFYNNNSKCTVTMGFTIQFHKETTFQEKFYALATKLIKSHLLVYGHS